MPAVGSDYTPKPHTSFPVMDTAEQVCRVVCRTCPTWTWTSPRFRNPQSDSNPPGDLVARSYAAERALEVAEAHTANPAAPPPPPIKVPPEAIWRPTRPTERTDT